MRVALSLSSKQTQCGRAPRTSEDERERESILKRAKEKISTITQFIFLINFTQALVLTRPRSTCRPRSTVRRLHHRPLHQTHRARHANNWRRNTHFMCDTMPERCGRLRPTRLFFCYFVFIRAFLIYVFFV